jgi:MFS transporter, SP family, arabinose:H+ symporter
MAPKEPNSLFERAAGMHSRSLRCNHPVTLSRPLIKATAISALGGLLFGIDTVAIAGSTHSLTVEYGLSPLALGITVSIALWGTVIGSIVCGIFGQEIERRRILQLLAAIYFISSFGCFFAWNWAALLLFRFIAGLGIGGSSVAVPVYLAEIAPATWRGRLVSCFQLNIGMGILLAFAISYTLDRLHVTNTMHWRIELGAAAIPALIFLALLSKIPASARWLISRNRLAEAHRVLQVVHSPEQQAEISEIIDGPDPHSREPDALFSRKYRRPILLAISIAAFNQLSGVNAVLYYLNDILARGGFSHIASARNAVWIGAINLVFSLGATAVVDSVGRKTLLLIGSVSMATCLAGMAISIRGTQHAVALFWCIVAFNFFFSGSQGAVIWVYISELFPTKIRLKGQSLGSGVHWILNAIIAGCFPILAKRIGAYSFLFFAGMMLIQFFVVLFFYPETRNLSLEQLDNVLKRSSSRILMRSGIQ